MIRTFGADRRAAADRRVLALLQHAQQPRLRLHRHVADLVEKQRAAFGLLEAADMAVLRAGEGALLVAEQLGLDEVLGDGAGVHGYERPRGPPRAVCGCARATSSLPVPVSPMMSTVASVCIRRAMHAIDFLHRPAQRPISGRRSSRIGSGLGLVCLGVGGSAQRAARTTEMSSFRSKGFGRYS